MDINTNIANMHVGVTHGIKKVAVSCYSQSS